MPIQRATLISFIAAAVVHLTAIYFGVPWLGTASKFLLMPLLAIFFIVSADGVSSTIVTATMTALVLSWCGDVLLIYSADHERLFLMGLIAFLLAHAFYIVSFRLLRDGPVQQVRKAFVLIRIVVLVLATGAVYFLLLPNLGTMVWPVALYTATIFTMAASALLRKGQTREKSFILVYIGALLFILSDTMIAIDRFLAPLAYGELLIMSTYILAQYLIVRGVLAHYEPDIKIS